MNPELSKHEKELMAKIMPMQGKHIFMETLGDGEIEQITRKNDGTGVYVYYHSNLHGQLKLDGEEFLTEVVDVRSNQ